VEPLDVLLCNDIILPKTQDEWKDIQTLLEKCSNTLKDITNLIGSKDKTYCIINTELKNFTKTYNEVENLQKKYVTKTLIFLKFSLIYILVRLILHIYMCISDWKKHSAIYKY